jgi:hypothetical protein
MMIRPQIKIKFVPQDCWVGVFWKREARRLISIIYPWEREFFERKTLVVYVCLVPCVPIKVTWRRDRKVSLEEAHRLLDEIENEQRKRE